MIRLNQLFFALMLSFFCNPLIAQDVIIQATVTTPPQIDYSTWRTERIAMQLQREQNTIFSSFLLQPAAVMGSAFFSAMAAVYIIALFSGNSERGDAKGFGKSIETLIDLIKAPFSLQHEKNKSRDRITRMQDELALRGLTI